MARPGRRSVQLESIRPQTDAEFRFSFRANLTADSPGRVARFQARPGPRLRSRPGLWAGDLVRGLQKSRPPPAPERLRRRRRVIRDCSSGCRTVEPLPRVPPPQRTDAGISSKTASAVDAIRDPTQNVLNLTSADVGVQLIQRALTAQRAIWCAEPLNGLFVVADHLDRIGINPREANRAIRLGGRQAGPLTQAA